MPLRSATLGGNSALQACLGHDEAHVTPGSRGNHVALIQKCLLVLERTAISGNEIRAKQYGGTTAAAVLAYKRARQIINRSYQTQADNIVGKMTIARLDADIANVEASRTLLVRCSQTGSGGGGARALVGRDVTVPAPPALVKLNRVLTIQLQRTDTVFDFASFANALLARTRDLLRPHGLTLVEGALMSGPPVAWPEAVVQTQFQADRFAVRKSAIAASGGDPKTLRVIVCPFDPIDEIRGITDGGQLQGVPDVVPKFVLINSTRRNPDHGTLLHEMVHASFSGESPLHDGDEHSIYSVATARDRVSRAHAEKLAGAFFARSVR